MSELDALLDSGYDSWEATPDRGPTSENARKRPALLRWEAVLLTGLLLCSLITGGWYDSETHPDAGRGEDVRCRGRHVVSSRLLFIAILSCLGLATAAICFRVGRRAADCHRVRLIIHMRPLSPCDDEP